MQARPKSPAATHGAESRPCGTLVPAARLHPFNINLAYAHAANHHRGRSSSSSSSGDSDDADFAESVVALQVEEPISLSEKHYPPHSGDFKRLLLAVLLLPLVPLAFLSLVLVAPSLSALYFDPIMAGLMSFLKSLLIPFLIAALIYALLTLLLLPLYRRHRSRYSQYLPVSLASTTDPTRAPGYSPWENGGDLTDDPPAYSRDASSGGVRGRLQDALLSLFMPSRWAEWRYRAQQRAGAGGRVVDARDNEEMDDVEMGVEDDTEDEHGEEGLTRDSVAERRRDAHERRDETSARRGRGESDRRLSRELEEGFRDSSDEDER